MARVVVATQTGTGYVVVPALTAANADGDAIDAGSVRLVVNNGSGAPVNVTVLATAEVAGLDVEDLVVPVAAGATAWIGPFPKNVFGQPTGANEASANDAGRVYVNYGAVASVTRGVVAV